MSKYDPLRDYLKRRSGREWRASFAEIERVLGFGLPASARRHPAWWSNELKGSHSHCRAWLGAGWHTREADPKAGRVTFRKGQNLARPGRRGLSPPPEATPSTAGRRPAESVALRLAWRALGPIGLDPGGRLLFPRVDAGPAVYRFRIERRGRSALYIGESDSFARRLQHYRTPGPTERTHGRIGAELATAVRGRHAVTLERLDGAPAVTVGGSRRALDLSDALDRRLAEQAALAAARAEAGELLNR